MSREELINLIRATERSPSLRRELQKCKNTKNIIDVAFSYGFQITQNDFLQDKNADKIENWFKNSKISPIKK